MERSENVSGMHKDDVSREIMRLLDGHELTDGLGNPLYIDVPAELDEGQRFWLKLTDHKGREGFCYVGVGR